MDSHHRCAAGARGGEADRVIEKKNSFRTSFLKEEFLDFRVVDAFYFVIIIESFPVGSGGDVGDGGEGVCVEIEGGLLPAEVVHED